MIASAACVRPLVETAAATWVDGRKISDGWGQIKRAGSPLSDSESFDRRDELLAVLEEMTWGAKFDERAAPDLAETWGRTKRTNILGPVEKLAKAVAVDLQSDHQWLCNTVHPSVGNTIAFSANPLRHETGTHFHYLYAGQPGAYPDRDGVGTDAIIEKAVARAATTALTVLEASLDAALRVIDDLGLTTNAPMVTRERYWRNVTAGGRNEPCVCRSGKKVKQCAHRWGDRRRFSPPHFGRCVRSELAPLDLSTERAQTR